MCLHKYERTYVATFSDLTFHTSIVLPRPVYGRVPVSGRLFGGDTAFS